MKSFPLTVYLLLCLSARLFSQSPVAEQILRIDPDNAFGGTAAKMLTEVEYIPLETTKESLFNRIEHLETTTNHFIIFDWKGDAVLIFDRAGKFVARLEPPGKSPGINQPAFYSFSVDHPRNEIIVRSGIWDLAPFLFVYDMKGKLLRKIKRQAEKIDECISMGNGWILSNSHTPEVRGTHTPQLILESENKVEQEWLPYDPQAALAGNDRFLQGRFLYNSGKGNFFFRNYYSNELVELDRQGPRHIYRVILPASYSLPLNFMTDSSMDNKRADFVIRHPQKVFCFCNIYRAGERMVFQLAFTGMEMKDRSLMYDFKSGRTYSLGNLQPDSSNAFLPLFGIIREVRACDGDNFYSAISAFDVYESQEKNTAKSPVYPQQIAQFLEKKDRMANPVIVRFRFKPEL